MNERGRQFDVNLQINKSFQQHIRYICLCQMMWPNSIESTIALKEMYMENLDISNTHTFDVRLNCSQPEVERNMFDINVYLNV